MQRPLSVSPLASAQDHALCRAMIKTGSRSFYAASLLLPAQVREDASALYAFCRLSDDMVDLKAGDRGAIERLTRRLHHLAERRPDDHAVDRALSDVMTRTGLPVALPLALIEGLSWDVEGVACETLSDLKAYAARVAGSVGAMMCVLMGVTHPHALARATDLGVAMQLTNVARDVGEDAQMGRLYLPRAWLREEGLAPEAFLEAPQPSPGVRRVVARLLSEAERLYARAESGIAFLPGPCRPGVRTAARLYAAIGGVIRANDHDSITQRARVGRLQKLRLAVGAWARSGSEAGLDLPPLSETAYLVAAGAQAQRPERLHLPVGASVSARLLWVAELFARLDADERARAAHRGVRPGRDAVERA